MTESGLSRWVFLPLGALFAFLASIMAALITYNEYSQHYRERKKAILAALQTGAVTFVFFLSLSLVIGIVLTKMLRRP